MYKTIHTLFLCLMALSCFSQNDSIPMSQEQYQAKIDSINNSFDYQHGDIQLADGVATLHVPKGYKFLDAKQSAYVLTNLWGNPPSEVLGLLFPENESPLGQNTTYAVEITYSKDGYINDEDAKDIDYDDLLEEMQKDTKTGNEARKAGGYPTIDLIGWASSPYYDSSTKKLHWAKELKFEGYETNTLNYNIRVLGRKGYLNLNAIGDMNVLPQFQHDANKILASVEFNSGHKYSDFNPDMDKVAAYGIGGLIAGKVLAKAGFFALIAKFWKIIFVAIAGALAAFRKKWKRNRE